MMKTDINRRANSSGKTMFLIASQAGSDQVLKWIYNGQKDDVDLYAQDRLGFSALKLAADEQTSMLIFFMLKGDDTKVDGTTRTNFSQVEWQSGQQRSIMNWQASTLSNAEFTTAYKNKGKADMVTHRGQSLLHVLTSQTANRDHLAKIKFAVKKAYDEELDLNIQDKGTGTTPLMNAMKNRDWQGACVLINAGADMTLPEGSG